MLDEEFRRRLQAANARIERGNDERAAGADDKARLIAAEAERRGRGGAKTLAADLHVSEKTISQAVARARGAASRFGRTMTDPAMVDALLEVEAAAVAPLEAAQWQLLAHLVRGTVIDQVWLDAPGQLLAWEVEEAEPDDRFEPEALIEACRSWTRVQALAVIDACQRGDVAALPTRASRPKR